MKQVLKRLEIIKNCIAIEDDETVEFQMMKLCQLPLDDKVQDIVSLIQDTDFERVVPLIDTYIQQFSSLVPYEDKYIQGLKLELKILEKQFLALACKVEEYHNIINDFNAKYHKELGTLLEEILVLREEYYEFMSQHNKEFEYEYYEAKKDFESFHEEFKKYRYDSPFELSKQQKKELKRLYKKASRLCHPDIIEDEKKNKSGRYF
jgi:DNA repair ATPase RecN